MACPRRPAPQPSAVQKPSPELGVGTPGTWLALLQGPTSCPHPQHLCDLAVHTALSRPGRPPPSSHFPQALGVPLPYRYFPSVNSALWPQDATPKAGVRGQSPYPISTRVQTKPLPSRCQQPRPGGNASGPGQKEAGQEEATGGGDDAPSSRSHHPPRPPRQLPDYGNNSSQSPKQKRGCHLIAGLAGRIGGQRRVPISGSWKAQADAAL